MAAGPAVVEGIAPLVWRPHQVGRGLEAATHPVARRADHQLLPGLTETVLGRGQSNPAPAVSRLHFHLAEMRRVPMTGTDSGPAQHQVSRHHQPLSCLAGTPGEQRETGPGVWPVDLA